MCGSSFEVLGMSTQLQNQVKMLRASVAEQQQQLLAR